LLRDIDLRVPGLSVADLSGGEITINCAIEGDMGDTSGTYPIKPAIIYFNTKFDHLLNVSLDRDGIEVKHKDDNTVLSFGRNFDSFISSHRRSHSTNN
jgi:hypothetical protein